MRKFAVIELDKQGFLMGDTKCECGVETATIISEGNIKDATKLCYCGACNCTLIRKLNKILKATG